MATGNVSINVMLAIHAKKTVPLDLQKPLRQYIVSHYSEREAKDMEEDLQTVQQMRVDIERGNEGLEAKRDLLIRYYKTLTVMENRFPISNEKEHINSISFTWYDAFKQGLRRSLQNIHFEKAAIVFCLAAVHSQLGLAADRSSAQGLKNACNYFQQAAGAFAFLRDNISMKAATGDFITLDVSVECAGMLERLMLAQAQECFFEKVVADKKPSTLCAKVSRQVGLYYEEACAALLLPPLNQHFDRTWVSHVQLKAAQYQAEALYRLGLDLHAEDNIAEEIARLRAAKTIMEDAKKACRGAAGPLMDTVSKLETMVARNLEQALKENDRVYLQRVPHNDSLPPVSGAPLVKPTPMVETLDAAGIKLFAALVPDSSTKALSKYTEMVDEVIRAQAERLQAESELARVKLAELGLPDNLLALNGVPPLPEKLRDDVEAVQISGGLGDLRGKLAQLKDFRRVNEELLVQTEEMLEKEARDDASMRSQLGTRWTRPASGTLTKVLRDRANGYAANLKQAGESDARVERSVADAEPLLSILNARPIEAALPRLSKPMVAMAGNEDALAASVRGLMQELETLGSQRAGLEEALKETKRKDNILPLLMTCTGSYEDLFKRELAKYDVLVVEVTKNIAAQDSVLARLRTDGEAFNRAFNVGEYAAQRQQVERQIGQAVSKFRELADNLTEGLKFYVTLQDAINALKQQAGDFILTRGIQSKEMLEEVQRGLTQLNFGGSSAAPSAGSTYPSLQQHQQQQHGAPPSHTAPPGHHMPSPPPSAPATASAPTAPSAPPPGPQVAHPTMATGPLPPASAASAAYMAYPGMAPGHAPAPQYYGQSQPGAGQPPPQTGTAPGYYGVPPGQGQWGQPPPQSGYGGWGQPPPNQGQAYGGWGAPNPYGAPQGQPPAQPPPGSYDPSQLPPNYYGNQNQNYYHKPQ